MKEVDLIPLLHYKSYIFSVWCKYNIHKHTIYYFKLKACDDKKANWLLHSIQMKILHSIQMKIIQSWFEVVIIVICHCDVTPCYITTVCSSWLLCNLGVSQAMLMNGESKKLYFENKQISCNLFTLKFENSWGCLTSSVHNVGQCGAEGTKTHQFWVVFLYLLIC